MENSDAISVSNVPEDQDLGFQSPPLQNSASDPQPPQPDHPLEIDEAQVEFQELRLKEEKDPDKGSDRGEENENVKSEGSDEDGDQKQGEENVGANEEDEEDEEDDEKEKLGSFGSDGELMTKKDDEGFGRRYQYPVRPEAEDCAYYMKTGTCKFGSNCKFNHPVRRKSQVVKDNAMEKEDLAEKPISRECKEEKECPYYMRTGSCKYASGCKFNHPDPTSGLVSDSPSGYDNARSIPMHGAPQLAIQSWSSPGTLSETMPFVPSVLSTSRTVPSQNQEWNGYQAPPSGRSLFPPPGYATSNTATETNFYARQQQMQVEEFPERPGQPDCTYFMKTGDCKFRSNCKYNHPKNRITKSTPCILSDKGLPLRPDQSICTHYSRYGICKFGPSCRFHHPELQPSSTFSETNQQPLHGFSVTSEGVNDVEWE